MACALLGAVGVAGLYFMVRPGSTSLDHFVFSLIPPRPRSRYVIAMSRLGSRPWWAWSVGGLSGDGQTESGAGLGAAGGPLATVVGIDLIVKPVVGRTFDGVLSFPSGTVTAVAALATVALLATPDPWRWGAGVAGGTVTVLMAVAVIGLGWHYPTDALGGLAFGAGRCSSSTAWRAGRRPVVDWREVRRRTTSKATTAAARRPWPGARTAPWR